MNRWALRLPGGWTWDQVLLILGPVAASVLLVASYAAGLLPVDWPALLVVVVLINLAGDIVYAIRNERSLKRGDAPLCNDVVGSRAVAEDVFIEVKDSFQGAVRLAGVRWRAVSDRRICAGDPVLVTGRRGLLLDVAPYER